MMSETTLQAGKEFRLPDFFTIANSNAYCTLVMVAHFDEIEARRLQVKPIARSQNNGSHEGILVEITLNEDGNGTAQLALPMSVDEDITFVLAVAYRCDLNDLMEITLTGEGLDPKEQTFMVNARRPKVEPTPAMPSLVERAQLPPGTIVDEGFPFSVDPLAPNGRDSMGNPLADFGKPGAHEEHAPTGTEPVGSGNTDMCPC